MSCKELRRASVLAGRKRRAETGECRGDFGVELSADQAIGTALPRRGSGGVEAPERGAGVEPKEVKEISKTSIAARGQEIFRGRKEAIRADLSRGTLG
jgi:hypothetical protein